MKRHTGLGTWILGLWVALTLLVASQPALAQDDPEERPAFSLSTSEVFTTHDAPNFYLTFRRSEEHTSELQSH